MPDAHDLTALVRHAIQAGDWRLVELLARMLGGRCIDPSPARRAYATLVLRLGLARDAGNYHPG